MKMALLTGDEEEVKRWNNRFALVTSERTEEQFDRDANNSLAATDNVEKVMEF